LAEIGTFWGGVVGMCDTVYSPLFIPYNNHFTPRQQTLWLRGVYLYHILYCQKMVKKHVNNCSFFPLYGVPFYSIFF